MRPRAPANDCGLFGPGEELFNTAAGIPICAELRDLILHQRDQRRDHDRGAWPRPAQAIDNTATFRRRWASPRGVAARQNAADDALLQGTECLISPVAAQGLEKIDF